MKATNIGTGHNRLIRITGLPRTKYNTPKEMTIEIGYISDKGIDKVLQSFAPCERFVYGSANVHKAIALDGIVIPAILKGLNR